MNIAVDPGINTGLAARMPDGLILTFTFRDDEVWDWFRQWHGFIREAAVEVFKRSNRIDRNMIRTMENVGGVKAICAMHGIRLWMNDNQSRKSFIPEARSYIEATGRKFTDHEVDATAHLLLLEYDLRVGTPYIKGEIITRK